jgi:hypothetical protein
LYAQEDCLDVVDGGPFFLEDVETDVAGHVDVGMVHGGDEFDDGSGIRVGRRECKGEFEGEVGVWLS